MQIKEIAIICDKGSAEVNEDIARIVGNSAYVLDGATGLNGRNLVSEQSDAHWFVNYWDLFLQNNINKPMAIKEIIREGIIECFEAYKKIVGQRPTSAIDFPSASFAIIRLKGKVIEYFILGDCSIVSKENSSLVFYLDRRLNPLDDTIYKKMRQLIKTKDIEHSEVKEILFDDIVENRLRKNTEDGYWVLEFDESAVDNAVEGSFEISANMEIAIMSDGFSAIVDKYHLVTTTEAFEKGIGVAIEKLREFEKEDGKVKRIPRFKVMDDASCIHIGFVDN